MKRTTATNSVGGLHVDRNPGSSTPGTKGIAEDRNNLQEEICNIIESAGFTLDGADQHQLTKASIALSFDVGDLIEKTFYKAPVPYASARSSAHPSYPKYFPAIPRWDADHDVTSAQAPDLVTALRAEKAMYKGVTDHAVTVAGSVITFSGAAGLALVIAVNEDAKCSNWFNLGQTAASPAAGDFATSSTLRCINIAGTDYPIAGANVGAGTLTVTGSPPSGAQTAILYPHRKSGAADTVRLHRIAGFVIVAAGDADGEYGAGMRKLDTLLGHRHQFVAPAGSAGTGVGYYIAAARDNTYTTSNQVLDPITDGTNPAPRTGKNTSPRALSAYPYTWAGRLLAWS